MPSNRWRVNRNGPEWLMDSEDRVIGYRDRRGREYFAPFGLQADGVQDTDQPAGLDRSGAVGAQAIASGDRFSARALVTTGSRSSILVNNARVDLSPTRMMIHDAMPENGSLVDPLSGMGNFSLLNVSRPLVPIANAVSAPYWTDPGPLLYSYDGSSGDGVFPSSIPGQIDFATGIDGRKYIKFTCPAGHGEGAASNGKGRVQLQSQQFSSRQTVRWELEFVVPSDDDGPYDAATGYNYPVLFWQIKLDDSQPVWTAAFVTTATPGVYQLRIGFLYSDYASDTGTHRRQVNGASAGFFNNTSSTTVYTEFFSQETPQSLSFEMRLDERDITAAGSGEGYCIIRHNGKRVVNWSGPTLQKLNINGAAAGPHRWSLGPYRYGFFQGGVPAGLEELDLNRQFNPAPYRRSIAFARAVMLQLEGPRFDRLAPKRVTSSRALTATDNGCVLDCADGITLTVPDTLVDPGFQCKCVVDAGGTISVARSGTATLNGAATTLTRSATSNPSFEIIQRASSLTSFRVTGS